MATQIGTMEFRFKDFTEDVFNESVNCTFEVWGAFDGVGMSLEQYWCMCRQFAMTMGYSEQNVDEWFGDR